MYVYVYIYICMYVCIYIYTRKLGTSISPRYPPLTLAGHPRHQLLDAPIPGGWPDALEPLQRLQCGPPLHGTLTGIHRSTVAHLMVTMVMDRKTIGKTREMDRENHQKPLQNGSKLSETSIM